MSRPVERVLISGLGAAGATLAWRLGAAGFDVTVAERAAAPRTGGYMVDFWGLGYEVAERLGVLPRLRERSYRIEEIRLVRADGRPLARIGAQAVRDAMGERFFSLPRGELADALYAGAGARARVWFDDEVTELEPAADEVRASFRSGRRGDFDLVVAADGVHSRVRGLALGEGFEVPMGYWAAALRIAGYPHRDHGAYVSFTRVGRQIARYALRDGTTSFFFVFRAPEGAERPPDTPETQRACLRQVYDGDGWEWPEILAREADWRDLYFDSVSQVRAPRWSVGRVALVGDAAYSPSLLAGEGASFAMAGAYVLAGELAASPEAPERVLAAYEDRLRGFIARKQAGARRMGGWFAPRTRLGLAGRNLITRLAGLPPFSRWLMGDMIGDRLELPAYPP